MKNGIILSAVMAALCASGETVKTATQPWVRSYVATNRTDVSGKADSTNVYTKAETDAKIVELSPPTSLGPSTNYTDAALGAFAATGAVSRATVYGTLMRWTDATGCVWEVQTTRVCTNVNEVWTYSVDGVTYTAEQMAEAIGGGDSDYSQTLIWMNSPFMGKDGEEEFGGWFIRNGSGTVPLGYSYDTGYIPESSADPYLALAEYNAFDYGGRSNVPVTAFRGTEVSGTNYVGRVALTNDLPGAISSTISDFAATGTVHAAESSTYSARLFDASYDAAYDATYLIRESTNAALAVADAKISTNNAAFVAAVLAVPLTGADAGDLAEIAEYGGYGTVGTAILALIAGLAALKRRMATAETAVSENATAVASVRADLPYRLVEPGEWEFSGSGVESGVTYTIGEYEVDGTWYYDLNGNGEPYLVTITSSQRLLTVDFWNDGDGYHITATRPSLPGHLCDRAGNRVVVTGDTTLTLPAANPGYARDFLVRLEISGSTVPTITFAAPTGETITYETDGDEFPVPDEAGDWLYSFTESCVAHKFAVSLKKVNEVAAPQAQGGS